MILIIKVLELHYLNLHLGLFHIKNIMINTSASVRVINSKVGVSERVEGIILPCLPVLVCQKYYGYLQQPLGMASKKYKMESK